MRIFTQIDQMMQHNAGFGVSSVHKTTFTIVDVTCYGVLNRKDVMDEHLNHHPDAHAGHEENMSHMDHTSHADMAMDHEGHDPHAGMTMDYTDHMDHAGMAMDHSGHGGHGGGHMHHAAMFKRLFFYSLILAVPTIALDPMFASLLHYSVPTTLPLTLIPAALGTVMYFWTGKPFLTGAADEIKSRKPGMMLLITLGITVAFVASWLATLGVISSMLSFWWELALLVVIMLAGHWIEMQSVMSTSSALDSISALLPATAHRTQGDTTEDVSLDELAVGDTVVVRPGETIPADGTVLNGTAGVNESMITGESLPVTRSAGDQVVAGSISTDSSLTVRIDAIGDETALSTIRRLVEDAENSKTPTQLLADRAAGLLFWYATAAALITAIVWLVLAQPLTALERVVTVLVIACPHALGLAIPLVVSIAMGGAASKGVLFSKRDALESMGNLTTVAFDKTGTLTLGTPHVVAVHGDDISRVIRLAAAAEQQSEHPLASAILQHATADSAASLPAATDFTSTPGLGVSAVVDGRAVAVGGPGLLESQGLTEAGHALEVTDPSATILYVVESGAIVGSIEIADEIRPESKAAIADLKAAGITTAMLTGDSQAVADHVAGLLGIDKVFAQVRPEEKNDIIASLQAGGAKVAMVGDGVNDAPALARADVGIAIGAGTDVAIDSADVVLAGSDPSAVLRAIQISRLSVRKMHQNLWWAAGYNLISVPLAAGVLAPIGFTMPMSVGAILMAVSTVVVVINARLLKPQISRL